MPYMAQESAGWHVRNKTALSYDSDFLSYKDYSPYNLLKSGFLYSTLFYNTHLQMESCHPKSI